MGVYRVRKRRIAVIASSRATYGYKRKIIRLIHESSDLEPLLIVTGMHLLKEYGYSVDEIERDGCPIAARVEMTVGGDTPSAWAKSIGVEIQSLAQVFEILKPDIVLVTGDRGEMFAAAATAAYMNIPAAHIQAGDVSGHIDGSARHAMTKLCHIHFPSCEDSATRVRQMGEEPWRIFNTGAPQLDEILHSKKMPRKKLNDIFGFDFSEPVILVIQHPVLVEHGKAGAQMTETMEAVKKLGMQTLVIYPNMDAGGLQAIDVIKKYESLPFIRTHRNIDREIFISLLNSVSVIIGNSSCGILEAPSFKLPAVNIGNRQRGRMQATNVINVNHSRREITKTVSKALFDRDFRTALLSCVNPYGDGRSSERIVKVLRQIKIDQKLLDKQITY
jgi:GDP/UDP-N,N'-diacetylbacillosamine 2-epimerase (hydrolysing)